MTIEERAKAECLEHYSPKCFSDGYIKGAREQRRLDEEDFCMFLNSLRESNTWEGHEWKFTRLWREYKKAMEQ